MIYYKSSIKMEEVPNESVHLVITSPPYPMIEKWDTLFAKHKAWYPPNMFKVCHSLLNKVWLECEKKVISGGILAINIGDATRRHGGHFVCWPNYAWILHSICNMTNFAPLIPIFWKKISKRPNAFLGSGFLPVNVYVSQDCEYIAIFRKGKLRQFSDEEKERRKQSAFNKQERDKWFSQIWNIPGKKGAGKTSSWPEEIPHRLIRMFSIIGDTVLDPFCGTGDEELCNSLDRNYIGYTLPEENP